jgi:two-component system OmpR family sensor kinase
MSLRRTLVLLQITLVAFGLVVFGVTSYQLYRNSEIQRLRQSLSNATPVLATALCRTYGGVACTQFAFGDHRDDGPGGGDRPGATTGPGAPATIPDTDGTTDTPSCDKGRYGPGAFNLPAGSFVELRLSSPAKTYRLQVPFESSDGRARSCPDPSLPAGLTTTGHRYLTASAISGPGPFLVLVAAPGDFGFAAGLGSGAGGAPTPSTTVPAALRGAVLIVATPMTGVTQSLHHLLVLDVGIGAVLLVALAVGTLVAVRRSLRPLERMAATSRAIAGGDLSRRVATADGRSEVGQLGLALNAMLNRIEEAFAERDATERRLRQFLADASHELRTPLTSIRGYAELWRLNERRMAAGQTADTRRDFDAGSATGDFDAGGATGDFDAGSAIGRIEEHARRMGEMIEELLLLARLDDTRPVGHDPVDLVVVAAEACDDAAAIDPGRPITFDAPSDVVVLGDRSHLRRAVANLTTNAVRHTPPGSRVDVAVRSRGGVAEVVVRDHGAGLPDEGLAHAFDRFWQADASRATGGSGLGLAIVAGVAAEHGGAATVANAPDGGAVFTLRLPLPLAGAEPAGGRTAGTAP